jgi:hypothetical protein
LRASLLLRIQSARIRWREVCARGAIASAAAGGPRLPLLRAASRDAADLRLERTPVAAALSRLSEAGVAWVYGDRPRALTALESAAAAFDAADMRLYAASVRRRRGEILGDAQGRDLVADADRWMLEQGIRNPERMAAALVPGPRAPSLEVR